MEKKKVHRRPATAAVSAAAVAVPFVAEAQQQPVGQTVNQGLVPNSWLVDASGNLIWLSEEDLKQYELAQLVTAEGVVQVDEAGAQVLGISTALLNQIGWYSVGAGAAAGAAAALGSGMFGNGAGSTTTSTSSDDVTPSSITNSYGSVTIVDNLKEPGDRGFEFIFEDPNGISRQHLIDRLEDTFAHSEAGTYVGIPPSTTPPLVVTTSVSADDLMPGTTSSYSKITAEVDRYLGGTGTKELFYKDEDGFVELIFVPVVETVGLSASVTVLDDLIYQQSTNEDISYIVEDADGIDRSEFIIALENAVGGASTVASIFPNGATVQTFVDAADLVPLTADVYTKITFEITGDTGPLNTGTFPGPEMTFYDDFGYQETINLQLEIL